MGIHLCSGPIRKKELLTVMLGGELVTGELGSTSTFTVQDVKMWGSLMRHSVCEEYKHSAWIQSLLISPKTG